MKKIRIARDKGDKEWKTLFDKHAGELFGQKYWRVILDEAHNIKNKDSRISEACSYIDARNRWMLTGTPLQNSTDEFFAALRFLITSRKEFMGLGDFMSTMGTNKIDFIQSQNMERQKAVNRAITLSRRGDDNLMGVAILEVPAPYPLEEMVIKFFPHETQLYERLQQENEDDELADPTYRFNRMRQVTSHWGTVLPDLLDMKEEWKAANSLIDPPPTVQHFCRACKKVLVKPVLASVSISSPPKNIPYPRRM